MPAVTYIASPYSHPDPQTRIERFNAACRYAAKLLARGTLVYSPIAHSHPIAMAGGLQVGWETWKALDLEMLERCDELVVLKLEGWEESKGVQGEIDWARGKLPIIYVDPSNA